MEALDLQSQLIEIQSTVTAYMRELDFDLKRCQEQLDLMYQHSNRFSENIMLNIDRAIETFFLPSFTSFPTESLNLPKESVQDHSSLVSDSSMGKVVPKESDSKPTIKSEPDSSEYYEHLKPDTEKPPKRRGKKTTAPPATTTASQSYLVKVPMKKSKDSKEVSFKWLRFNMDPKQDPPPIIKELLKSGAVFNPTSPMPTSLGKIDPSAPVPVSSVPVLTSLSRSVDSPLPSTSYLPTTSSPIPMDSSRSLSKRKSPDHNLPPAKHNKPNSETDVEQLMPPMMPPLSYLDGESEMMNQVFTNYPEDSVKVSPSSVSTNAVQKNSQSKTKTDSSQQ
jgi:hypothetical protein